MRGILKLLRRSNSMQLTTNEFDDVVLVTKTPDTTKMRIFLKRWTFPNTDQLILVKQKLMAGESGVHKVEFFDTNHVEYHDFSPLEHLADEDFMIRINGVYNICFINGNMNFEDLFHNDKSLEEVSINELVNSTNKNGVARKALSETVTYIVQKMYEDPNQGVKDIIKEKLLKDAVYFEKKRHLYNTAHKALQVNLAKKKMIHYNFVEKNELKAQRRIKFLSFFVLCQAAFTQYGSYVSYSWDIMEPIVCFFGTVDMFLAYLFWYIHGKDFDYAAMYRIYKDKATLSDDQLNEMKLYEYETLIDVVKNKTRIFSSDILDVMEVYADTRDKEIMLSDEEDNK